MSWECGKDENHARRQINTTRRRIARRRPIGFYKDSKGRTRPRTSRASSHLYRNGAKYREQKKFEKEYGKEKGDYVYGAVVGKVKREQLTRRGKR